MRGTDLFSKVGMPLLGGLALLLMAPGGASAQSGDWSMYNHDPSGSRFNGAEKKLGASNVGNAKVLWKFEIPDASVSGTPAVVDGTVYAGDSSGRVWAVSASKGKPIWHTQLSGPITASALVTGELVIIGVQGNFADSGANLYGLDRSSGKIKWKTVLDPDPLSAIYGSATTVRKYVAVGVASNEESATMNPLYPCCHTRGSLALVDPKNGAIVWQTYTVEGPGSIEDGQGNVGPSGASIWSTPTFDGELNLIYATTGNNFSEPTTETSDAILAFDATSGEVMWFNQRTEGDLWNFRYPFSPTEHPDFDFGDSAQVYTLSNGRKVVGAGQKSGFYHVLDAATGAEVLDPEQYVPGGILGGLFADSAVANGVIYANAIQWDPFNPASFPRGHLFAFSADTLAEEWHFENPGSPNITGVAVANGVVYFQSLFDGNLYALDAITGAQLLALPVGPSLSGPAVSNGRVYMGTGDAVFRPALGAPAELPGGIVAVGLP